MRIGFYGCGGIRDTGGQANKVNRDTDDRAGRVSYTMVGEISLQKNYARTDIDGYEWVQMGEYGCGRLRWAAWLRRESKRGKRGINGSAAQDDTVNHITSPHITSTQQNTTTQNNTKSQHRQNITEQCVTKVKEKSVDNAQDNDNKKQQVKARQKQKQQSKKSL